MKYVLLLGDSVRQNYQEYVKEELKGVADVRYPNDNGKFGYYTLRYVYEWIDALSRADNIMFDIIHFNVGLWDVLRLASDNSTFTGETEYASVLMRIYKRIRMYCPKAKIIFALTTTIIEPGFAPGIEVGERRNSDIKRFNEIAVETFKDTDVFIDDLFTVSKGINDRAHSDNVHFETELGIKILGDAVVRSIVNTGIGADVYGK